MLCALLAGAPAAIYSKQRQATPMHFAPRWDWDTVNFWSTIAYAMSGMELAGMMGGGDPRPRANPAARRLDRLRVYHCLLHRLHGFDAGDAATGSISAN